MPAPTPTAQRVGSSSYPPRVAHAAAVDEGAQLRAAQGDDVEQVPVELRVEGVPHLGAHDEDVARQVLAEADAADRTRAAEAVGALVGNDAVAEGVAEAVDDLAGDDGARAEDRIRRGGVVAPRQVVEVAAEVLVVPVGVQAQLPLQRRIVRVEDVAVVVARAEAGEIALRFEARLDAMPEARVEVGEGIEGVQVVAILGPVDRLAEVQARTEREPGAAAGVVTASARSLR